MCNDTLKCDRLIEVQSNCHYAAQSRCNRRATYSYSYLVQKKFLVQGNCCVGCAACLFLSRDALVLKSLRKPNNVNTFMYFKNAVRREEKSLWGKSSMSHDLIISELQEAKELFEKRSRKN